MAAGAYTVVAADAGKLKWITAATTVTLPANVLAPGQRVDFCCAGGIGTFVVGSGATWNPAPTPSAVGRAVGSFVTAMTVFNATQWALTGDLA
jgi:hypothetical protein